MATNPIDDLETALQTNKITCEDKTWYQKWLNIINASVNVMKFLNQAAAVTNAGSVAAYVDPQIEAKSSNTRVGKESAFSNTTGSNWTANGMYAGYSNTTGSNWTANGMYAGYSNTTGNNWIANGYAAGYSNTTGNNWTANGNRAGYLNTTGSNWTANGYAAGYDITTGDANTIYGCNTGRGIVTGSNNTIIGANVTGLPSDLSGNIILSVGNGTGIPEYASNADAINAGLIPNKSIYHTGGDLKVAI